MKYLSENGLLYFCNRLKTIIMAAIPSKTSELANDSGFLTAETDPTVPSWAKAATKPSYTAAEVGALPDTTLIPSITGLATESYVQSAIAGITGMNFEIVSSLPASGAAGNIYLLANEGSAPNIYDEYIWVNQAFEKIGTTAVDLSGYVQASDLVAITNAEIDTIVAS